MEPTLHLVGKQDRVSTSRGEQPSGGYQTDDIRAGFGLASGVSLRGGVLNAWDQEYANHLNAKNPFSGQRVPEPGRVFFLDIAWSF